MNCTICGKKITLVPSAKERADKYGGKPSDYTKLFTQHSACALDKRERETRELMQRRSQPTITFIEEMGKFNQPNTL
jgi:hypothetical protein